MQDTGILLINILENVYCLVIFLVRTLNVKQYGDSSVAIFSSFVLWRK
jgi:hypothetical protein